MPADIVLTDRSVMITGGGLQINRSPTKENPIGDPHWFKIDFVGFEHSSYSCDVTLGDKKATGSQIEMISKYGSSRISDSFVSTKRVLGSDSVSGRHGAFLEVTATRTPVGGPEFQTESSSPGVIEVLNTAGEPTVVLDGKKGDVTLADVGSLLDIIKELRAEVASLKRKVG